MTVNDVILDQTVTRGNTKLNIFAVYQVAAYIRMNNVILDQTVRQRGNTKLNIFAVCQVAVYIRTNNVTLERTVKTTREYKVEHSHNYNFPIDCWAVLFETTNSRTHESLHFVETTNIGANE
jgi:hypothetical protein